MARKAIENGTTVQEGDQRPSVFSPCYRVRCFAQQDEIAKPYVKCFKRKSVTELWQHIFEQHKNA